MRQLFLVSERRGGPWDWTKDLREQGQFYEHAEFMDRLVDEGFVVLGGPLDERDVLLIVESETEAELQARFQLDPWIQNGMLTITAIRPWTNLLEGTLGTTHRTGPDFPRRSPRRPSVDIHRQ